MPRNVSKRKPSRKGAAQPRGPNPQQRLFALEYVACRNGKEAALRAGYAAGSAADTGHKLLKDPRIKALVEKGLRARERRTEITIDRVVRELHDILTVDIGDCLDSNGAFLPVRRWPEGARRALSGIETEELYDENGELCGYWKKVRFWNKTKSADQLLRHLGGYAPEKHEVTVGLADIIAAAKRKREGGE
jgi:phage terminase small subunit